MELDLKLLRRLKHVCITVVATLSIASSGRADEWEYYVAPYMVLPFISGEASLGRIEDVDVDISPSDVLDSLDFGAMFQLEARHQTGFGALLNYAFMDLGGGGSGPRGLSDARVDVFQGTLEAFGTYTTETSWGPLGFYFGARWWDIDLDVDIDTPSRSESASRDEDWVDPVIGARTILPLTDELRFLVQGDIGGFGAASDFTWAAQAGILWDICDGTSIAFLYKALGVDYTTGVRDSKSYFEYDTITQGPLIGAVFRF